MDVLDSPNKENDIEESESDNNSESFLISKTNEELKALVNTEVLLDDGLFVVHYEKTIGCYGLKKLNNNKD